MLATAGSQTITITDQANKTLSATIGPIEVTPGPLNKFLVSVLGGNTLTAGNAFLVTVQAADKFGNCGEWSQRLAQRRCFTARSIGVIAEQRCFESQRFRLLPRHAQDQG